MSIFRLITFGACLLGLSSVAIADDAVDPAEFMETMMERFQAEKPDHCVKPLANEFGFTMGPTATDCEEITTYLDNIFDEVRYAASDEERMAIVDNFVTNIVGMSVAEETDLSDLPERLVVQLRPIGYLDFIRQQLQSEVVSRPFQGDLHAVLMRDSEQTLSAIEPDQLVEVGLTEDDAFRLAKSNLQNRIGEIQQEDVEGLTLTYTDTDLTTGILYQDDACTKESSDTAYFVFHRYQFISAELDDREAVGAITDLFSSMVSSGESMSETLLLCMSGEWAYAFPSDESAGQ